MSLQQLLAQPFNCNDTENILFNLFNDYNSHNAKILLDFYSRHPAVIIIFYLRFFYNGDLLILRDKNMYEFVLYSKSKFLLNIVMQRVFQEEFFYYLVEKHNYTESMQLLSDGTENFVLRIFNKFDIPINEDNIIIKIISSRNLRCIFRTFTDKNPKFNKIIKNINEDRINLDSRTDVIASGYLNHFTLDYIPKTIYKDNIIRNIQSTPENVINKWKECYTQYIQHLISTNVEFVDVLSFYTHTGDCIMHNFLRNLTSKEMTPQFKQSVLNRLNILNKGIYDSYHFANERCRDLTEDIVLYRGIDNKILPFTKGSIINNHKNQFVSFTSEYTVASGFGQVILRLTISKDDIHKIIFPITDLTREDGEYISRYASEEEWLLPLNTSFIITDVLHYKYHPISNLILDVKIHSQEYIPNIDENTFTPEILDNVFLNKIQFIKNINTINLMIK